MSDEMFDVVDGNDLVIGVAPRDEVHRLGLHHRAVHVFVFNAAGSLFLQFRSHLKTNHPSVWDSSCSGHVSAGDDYDQSALRELEEELGLPEAEIRDLARLFKIPSCEATEQEHVWLYRMHHEGPFRLQPEEIDDGRWFTMEEVDSLVARTPEQCAPAFVHIWGLYRRFMARP